MSCKANIRTMNWLLNQMIVVLMLGVLVSAKGLATEICSDVLFDEQCKDLVNKKLCEKDSKYYRYMTERCAKSCGFCEDKREDECVNDVRFNPNCEYWEKKGYCDKDSKFYNFVTKYCKKSCGICKQEVKKVVEVKAGTEYSNCADNVGYASACPGWKDKKFCESSSQYYNFMQKNCQKSCGVCTSGTPSPTTEIQLVTTASPCFDSNIYKTSCPSWKTKGLCESGNKYYNFMKANCKNTCGLCPTETKLSCGKSSKKPGRVVGGSEAEPHTWPWQAGLWYDGKFFCGGTLVDYQWIVTAAHCVVNKVATRLKVTLGDHSRFQDEGTEQHFITIKIIYHPDYNPKTEDKDIALIKLDRKAKYDANVVPACLPDQSYQVTQDQFCYLTGWGQLGAFDKHADVLQEVRMPVVSNTACNSHNAPVGNTVITENMICAGYGYGTRQSGCRGDSGGPLSCKRGDKWELQGVVSWGSSGCLGHEKYTVFTRVGQFSTWVKQTINSN